MVTDLKSISDYDYSERIKFWPVNIDEKKERIGNNLFNDNFSNNFWILSEQYYTLAWSLLTASYDQRALIPYSGELEVQEIDDSHRNALLKKIKINTWSLNTFRPLAHLSCELAFKTIIFHKSTNPSQMNFKYSHDLQDLFYEFDIKTQKSFKLQYEDWPEKKDLELTIFESGKKFITQRYGDRDNSNNLDIFYLCKFIHEKFNLENI